MPWFILEIIRIFTSKRSFKRGAWIIFRLITIHSCRVWFILLRFKVNFWIARDHIFLIILIGCRGILINFFTGLSAFSVFLTLTLLTLTMALVTITLLTLFLKLSLFLILKHLYFFLKLFDFYFERMYLYCVRIRSKFYFFQSEL